MEKLNSIQVVLDFIVEKIKLIPEPTPIYTPPYNPAIDNINEIIFPVELNGT